MTIGELLSQLKRRRGTFPAAFFNCLTCFSPQKQAISSPFAIFRPVTL
jgi:hypothetical protein